jgi:hypothetical protein
VNVTTLITGRLRAARRKPRPRAALPRDRRRTAARSLAIGFAALAVLNLALGVAGEESLYIRDPGYSDKEIRLARQEAANPTGPGIVMLGTSRTAAAFAAGRVRDKLGSGVVFNFGIPASGPITHSVYLKRLLADGHKPDLLLLEVLPPTLVDLPAGPTTPAGPLEGRFLYGDRLTHGELDRVIDYGFPAEDVRRRWRQSVYEPWYALRFPIVGRAFPSALPWHVRFDWSRGCDEFGWGAPFQESVTPTEFATGFKQAHGEYADILAMLEPTGGGARALVDTVDLCRERGIAVRLVLMPESSHFRAMYPPEAERKVYEFLDRVCREHGCTLVNARHWLPDDAFWDGHHMVKPGAVLFTDMLAKDSIEPFVAGR